jgi:RNA:NAD 2'-phosphotransferase (TPT1/KptA family)
MKYRARLRGFDLARIEEIVRHSSERYLDIATGRYVAVGRHGKMLVAIPYEMDEDSITPITIHATTRQQINFRLRTGRYSHG